MTNRPPWPYLPLLPLLVLLLFGNCGGGVRGLLSATDAEHRLRLRAILVQERTNRSAARRQRTGKNRHLANSRVDSVKAVRLDSFFRHDYGGYLRDKYQHRRRKLERQALRVNNRALIPAIRIPLDTR
ncbi:hypothetical protein ACFQ48_09540 [Hymenobacter caeli]|uniref:Uncharacterized protein n=1 Tax=Hymenobacter caeli TaxID=2735894 RepID=A0ABX2FMF2_9BACT|nr:hypothetical protein [Hymenobacter caeli]NRT18312.1 hypothetical protein [Hymenobacter caeli]